VAPALTTVDLDTAELRSARGAFFTIMIDRVHDNCPIDFHKAARERRRASADLI
jgi:hypothetical protein